VDRSSAGPSTSEDERGERLIKAWITQLVERTPLAQLATLPLGRIAVEAPSLIATIHAALADPARGPAELARAARDLEQMFGAPPAGTTPATPSGSHPGVRVGAASGEADRVTGLPGPDALDRCLTGLLAEQRRYGHPFAIALVDVDGLARINDAYGREAGDRMLAAVAAVLRRQLREVDFAFRVEDDEFAIVAPHTDAARLVTIARRVANLIADSQSLDGPRIAVAAGIAGCPADGLAAERLLESATEAIYAAKASGAAVARSPDGSDAILQDS
jgi:diguanylate cyclase (GGDEF)-like protein